MSNPGEFQRAASGAPSVPPAAPSRAGTQPQLITPFVEVIEAWLRADIEVRASVVHERLVDQYGFTGHYQRVKLFVAGARPRIADELAEDEGRPLTGLHRRFEVVAGAQAQVDWGEEGDVLAHVGIKNVYSFHMTLSYSRWCASQISDRGPYRVLSEMEDDECLNDVGSFLLSSRRKQSNW